MSIKAPFTTATESVYHNNSECKSGQKIARADMKIGKGDKPLCPECEALKPAPVQSAEMTEMLKRLKENF